MHFDYTWDKTKGNALGLQQIWRDDKFTYLRGQFQETPALYELKDEKASLINFDFNGGLYTVPKQLDDGYLAIGKQKVEFHRTGESEVAMSEPNLNPPATVPEQPEAKPPLRKSMPVVIALVAIIALIGIANISSLLRGNKKTAPPSAMPMRPVSARRQAGDELRDTATIAGQARCRGSATPAGAGRRDGTASGCAGRSGTGGRKCTADDRRAAGGDLWRQTRMRRSPDIEGLRRLRPKPNRRRSPERSRQQDAINSDTVAIDFEHPKQSDFLRCGSANNRAPEADSEDR